MSSPANPKHRFTKVGSNMLEGGELFDWFLAHCQVIEMVVNGDAKINLCRRSRHILWRFFRCQHSRGCETNASFIIFWHFAQARRNLCVWQRFYPKNNEHCLDFTECHWSYVLEMFCAMSGRVLRNKKESYWKWCCVTVMTLVYPPQNVVK